MEKQVIKKGTKVEYRLPNDKETNVAVVVAIEECECGEKYGEPIDEVNFDDRAGDFGHGVEYSFSLDNHKWCYGYQIVNIINN